MNTVERLKQARNLNELAERVEPLAQALAALADDTRQTLTETQESLERQLEVTNQTTQQLSRTLNEASQKLAQSAREAQQASWSMTWKPLMIAVLSGIGSALALSVLSHWLQPSEATQRQQRLGATLEQRWETMTDSQRLALSQLMGWKQPQ